MIRKLIVTCVLAMCTVFGAGAQYTLSQQEMIAITPMLSSHLDIPKDASKSLEVKLMQMVTQNGFGSTSGDFVLSANVVTLNKEATATAPVQYVVELEVSFFVVNVTERVIIDEMSFTVTGVDRSENKAVIQAINQIKPKSTNVRLFMNNVRDQLVVYYNTRIPVLVKKAQSLSEMGQYEDALVILSAVPESCEEYALVGDLMVQLYRKMVEGNSAQAIQKARAAIAKGDYETAADYLGKVDPASEHVSEAVKLLGEIEGKLTKRNAEELETALQVYCKESELQMAVISASRDIAVERSKSSNSAENAFNEWFYNTYR